MGDRFWRGDFGKGFLEAVEDGVGAGGDEDTLGLVGEEVSDEVDGWGQRDGRRVKGEGKKKYLLGFVEADLAGCHASVLEQVGPGCVYYGDIVAFVACCSRQIMASVSTKRYPDLSRWFIRRCCT